ncbi:hypothetical protein SESBI_26080 [Sesbania bispinosa]|nr:hypothetical protein SESBI_26080 [Sesbania bispinosa]
MEQPKLSLQESDLYLRSRKKVKIGDGEEDHADADQHSMEEEEGDKSATPTQQHHVSYKESLLNQIGLQDQPLFEVDDVVFPGESTDEERTAMEEETHQVKKSRNTTEDNNQTNSSTKNEIRPKGPQDNQDSSSHMIQDQHSDPTTSMGTAQSGTPLKDSEEIGVYGPWMLVKKVPRKKPQGKPISAPYQQPSYQPNSPDMGTRFSLLNTSEEEIDGHNHLSSISEDQPPTVRQSTIIKIRDHNAGKNSQNSQEKKNQNRSVQKNSVTKVKPGIQSHQNPKNSISVPTPMVKTGNSKVTDGSGIKNPSLLNSNVGSNGPVNTPTFISSQQDLHLKRQKEQEILQVMRIMNKDGGSKGDMLKLQSEYLQALTSTPLNPKPPDKGKKTSTTQQSICSDTEMNECMNMQDASEFKTQTSKTH